MYFFKWTFNSLIIGFWLVNVMHHCLGMEKIEETADVSIPMTYAKFSISDKDVQPYKNTSRETVYSISEKFWPIEFYGCIGQKGFEFVQFNGQNNSLVDINVKQCIALCETMQNKSVDRLCELHLHWILSILQSNKGISFSRPEIVNIIVVYLTPAVHRFYQRNYELESHHEKAIKQIEDMQQKQLKEKIKEREKLKKQIKEATEESKVQEVILRSELETKILLMNIDSKRIDLLKNKLSIVKEENKRLTELTKSSTTTEIAYEEKIQKLEQEKKSLESENEELKRDFLNLQKTVEELENGVEKHKKQIEESKNLQEIREEQLLKSTNQLSTICNRIATLKYNLGTDKVFFPETNNILLASEDVDDVNNDITTIESAIETIENDKKSDQEKIKTQQETITKLEERLANVSSRMNELTQKQNNSEKVVVEKQKQSNIYSKRNGILFSLILLFISFFTYNQKSILPLMGIKTINFTR